MPPRVHAGGARGPRAAADAAQLIRVQLLQMPVHEFARFRAWFVELRRELRLLALAHGDDYPVAKELSELTQQSERERHEAFGLAALDKALAEGRDHIDLTYEVPETTPTTMARLLEVLERADEFCREQRLLDRSPALPSSSPCSGGTSPSSSGRGPASRPDPGRVEPPSTSRRRDGRSPAAPFPDRCRGARWRPGRAAALRADAAFPDRRPDSPGRPSRSTSPARCVLALLPAMPPVRRHPHLPALLGTGVLGRLHDAVGLRRAEPGALDAGHAGTAAVYVLGTLAACLLAVAAGRPAQHDRAHAASSRTRRATCDLAVRRSGGRRRCAPALRRRPPLRRPDALGHDRGQLAGSLLLGWFSGSGWAATRWRCSVPGSAAP